MVKDKKCENCGKKFKAKQEINGEQKNLYGRKYCLECSPYKKGNTAQLGELAKDKDDQISYIKGVLDSDGCLFKANKSYKFSVGVTDKDFIDEIKIKLDDVLDSNTNIVESVTLPSGKQRYDIQKGSKALYNRLKKMKGAEANAGPYLRAFFSGDGSISETEYSTYIRTQITDGDIIQNVQTKLREIGIETKIKEKENTDPRYADEYYVISFGNKEDLKKFNDAAGFSIKRKQEKLSKAL